VAKSTWLFPRQIAIQKVRKIQGVACKWFTLYLAERKQFVSIIGSEQSTSRPLTCGVLQGSVLGPLLCTMYTGLLRDIMRHHEVSFHQYADDTQTYCAFKTSDAGDLDETKLKQEACINSVNAWMLHNNLQLNDNKMKILVFHAKHLPAPSLDCLQVSSTNLKPTDHARNIWVILDSNISFDQQIEQNICKSAFHPIRSIIAKTRL